MPLKLFYLPSYERCVKRLGSGQKQIAGLVISALWDYFSLEKSWTGAPHIFNHEGKSHRLIFKKLHENVWEAYVDGKVRVLTRLEKNIHYLVFVGNHDQVKQFLKEI
jgi:hypothetical protein